VTITVTLCLLLEDKCTVTVTRGYVIDLEALDPDTFLQAMIASFDGDEAPLTAAIQGLTADEDPRDLA
jgi:hypothetical protein